MKLTLESLQQMGINLSNTLALKRAVRKAAIFEPIIFKAMGLIPSAPAALKEPKDAIAAETLSSVMKLTLSSERSTMLLPVGFLNQRRASVHQVHGITISQEST